MSGSDQHGLGGALRPAIEAARAEIPDGEGEQLDLVEMVEAAEPLADRPLLGAPSKDARAGVKRGPGRPPGARNRRTEELARYILERYRDPLVGLASIVSTPIEQLAADLGCKKVDAADFWRKCASELLPYVHQRKPQALQVDGRSAGALLIMDLRHQATDAGAELVLDPASARPPQDEQNQGLSEGETATSHGEPSHGGDK